MAVKADLGPGHCPDDVVALAQPDGVAAVLVEELRHGVLDQKGGLVDPHDAGPVGEGGVDKQLFLVVVFHVVPFLFARGRFAFSVVLCIMVTNNR